MQKKLLIKLCTMQLCTKWSSEKNTCLSSLHACAILINETGTSKRLQILNTL